MESVYPYLPAKLGTWEYPYPPLLTLANTWTQTQKFQLAGSANYAAINWNSKTSVGVYEFHNNLFYGIFATLPTPSGATGIGGYYNGVGVGGTSHGTGTPIFGVLNDSQSANGIGHTTLTIYDNNVIESFYVELGAQPKAISPTVASGTVYQNTTNSYQTLVIPVYASTAGTAGSVAIALGPSSTPAAWGAQYVSGSTSSSACTLINLRVPPQWYYSVTATDATIGTPAGIQE